MQARENKKKACGMTNVWRKRNRIEGARQLIEEHECGTILSIGENTNNNEKLVTSLCVRKSERGSQSIKHDNVPEFGKENSKLSL